MDNFSNLIQQNFGKLTKEELKIIQSYFKEEKLLKNEFFTKEDKVCNKLSIIKSGILRIYTITNGKEITQWLSTENNFITEVSGFFFDQPNRWSIKAFTDTELLTITKSDYHSLCKQLPKWNGIEKRFIVQCFAMLENRVFSHLSMSAQERYDLYFQQNKALFNQVPLQYIASILGMSPETFSRIRKRKTENS